MFTIWTYVLFVHVLGAIIWVGGQLTLSLVVVPVSRSQLPDEEQRLALLREAGRRYALVAVAIVLPLQVATGLALAFHQGVDGGSFGSGEWGQILSVKIVLVVVAVGLAALHGVLSARQRTRDAKVASYAGLLASLVVVLLGVALVG